MEINKIYNGDAESILKSLPDCSIDCCVTSPPYFNLRDYGMEGQIGLEDTPEAYIDSLVSVFREVRRVLKEDGTLWVNIGDSYASSGKGAAKYPESIGGSKQSTNRGSVGCSAIVKKLNSYKPKDMIGIPWMLAFALRADGWHLRQDIIWHKPNPMPESVTDRCTKSHEYIFLLSKSQRYYFDHESIQEEATGYDGRKDTLMKGSKKYSEAVVVPNQNIQTMAMTGHERWKFKNLAEKGQQPNTMHKLRAEGYSDYIYPVRNKRDVWTVNLKPFIGAHFATFPEELIKPCILAGCREGGVVLDPFMGSGTTAVVAKKLNRNYVGVELNPAYVDLANQRLIEEIGLFL